jgi:ubiquinone/menaquinone biosynthesis C-methylase UbiE
MSNHLQDIIEWDIRNWSISLNYWLKESTLDFVNSHALEIGGRNGGLSLWLAKQGCKVTCSDVSGPSEKARDLHQKHGINHLVEYKNIDATNIPYDNDVFDIVVFKSVLGGIGYNNNKDAQCKAINEIYRVLRPGGELFFAENLVASPLHTILRKYFTNWGNTWRYLSINEIEEFLNPFSYRNYFSTGFLAALGRSEKQRDILGLLDNLCVNKLTPKKWKYIVVGLAKK